MKEIRDFDQYVISVDGTGRLTLRNRQFLRRCPDVATPNHSFQSLETSLSEPNVGQEGTFIPSQPPANIPPNPDVPSSNTEKPDSKELLPTSETPYIRTPLPQNINEPPSVSDIPTVSTPQQQHFNEPSSLSNDSQMTSETEQNCETVKLRRSERVRKATQFYNAEDGSCSPANG